MHSLPLAQADRYAEMRFVCVNYAQHAVAALEGS